MAGRPKRAMPRDFKVVAPTMPIIALSKHYRASDSTVKAWLAETGVQSGGINRKIELPANLHELAEGQTLSSLAKLLGCNQPNLGKRLKREFPELHAALAARGRANSIERIATMRGGPAQKGTRK